MNIEKTLPLNLAWRTGSLKSLGPESNGVGEVKWSLHYELEACRRLEGGYVYNVYRIMVAGGEISKAPLGLEANGLDIFKALNYLETKEFELIRDVKRAPDELVFVDDAGLLHYSQVQTAVLALMNDIETQRPQKFGLNEKKSSAKSILLHLFARLSGARFRARRVFVPRVAALPAPRIPAPTFAVINMVRGKPAIKYWYEAKPMDSDPTKFCIVECTTVFPTPETHKNPEVKTAVTNPLPLSFVEADQKLRAIEGSLKERIDQQNQLKERNKYSVPTDIYVLMGPGSAVTIENNIFLDTLAGYNRDYTYAAKPACAAPPKP